MEKNTIKTQRITDTEHKKKKIKSLDCKDIHSMRFAKVNSVVLKFHSKQNT